MKQDIAERWVTALRSKKFKQAKGRLKKPESEGNGYCCLGVLCELAVEEGIVERRDVNRDDGYAAPANQGLVDKATLPPAVRVWAGMKDSAGTRGSNLALTELNDTGSSFDEIADVIEQDVEIL